MLSKQVDHSRKLTINHPHGDIKGAVNSLEESVISDSMYFDY